MVYTFVIDIVYLNLNSIFNILNATMTKHRFLSQQKDLIMDIELRDFIKILTI